MPLIPFMMPDCDGCLQIQELHFPFYRDKDDDDIPCGNYSIDMEGCGRTADGLRFTSLEIFYCPVCGTKL